MSQIDIPPCGSIFEPESINLGTASSLHNAATKGGYMNLYALTDEQRLEGVPGSRVTAFSIEKQQGRIFFGALTFSDAEGIPSIVEWRASYMGPSVGYTVHERRAFQEKLHHIPAVSAALRRFISEHINNYRELPKPDTLSAENLRNDTMRESVSSCSERTAESAAPEAHEQLPESENSSRNKKPPSLEETAQMFRTLSDRLRLIASYLADDAGAQQIADALGITKDTLKGYFCQLREKFSMGVPKLRELFRTLFKFDASLRISASSPPAVETTAAASVTMDVPLELFGKEVLRTFSQRERAVAGLLTSGLSLSQIASKTNLRLSDVGVCRAKLKKFLRCLDDNSFLSCLKDIAEGKEVPVATAGPEEKEREDAELSTGALPTPAESANELLMFPAMMQAVEEFRAKLSPGYELSLGDCIVVPGGNVVSVSIRVKQSR